MPQETPRFTPLDTPQQAAAPPRFTPLDGPVTAATPQSDWGWYEGVHKALTAPGTLFGPDLPHGPQQTFSQISKQALATGKDPEEIAQQQYGGAGMNLPPNPTIDLGATTQPGFAKGVLSGVSGLTSPGNMAQLAILPESKLINLVFTGQMGYDTYQRIMQGRQQSAAGNQPGANQAYGEAAVSGLMTGLTGMGLREGKAAGEQRFTPLDTETAPAAKEGIPIVKGPAPQPPMPKLSGIEMLAREKKQMASGGAQPNYTDEGTQPVSNAGLTAANQPGSSKSGMAPSDSEIATQAVEKQAATSPMPIMDLSPAKAQLVENLPRASKPQAQEVVDLVSNSGILHKALNDFPETQNVHLLEDTTGLNLTGKTGGQILVELQKAGYKVAGLEEAYQQGFQQQQLSRQQPTTPRFTPLDTPKGLPSRLAKREPFKPAADAPSTTRGNEPRNIADLLEKQQAAGKISQQEASTVADRAGVSQAKQVDVSGKRPGLDADEARAKLQQIEQLKRSKGRSLPKQSPEDIAADARLLEESQAPKTPATETPEAVARPLQEEGQANGPTATAAAESVAKKYGLLLNKGADGKGTGEAIVGSGVYDFKAPDGGSFNLKEADLTNDKLIQQKLAERSGPKGIKTIDLSPVLSGKKEEFQQRQSKELSVTPLDRTGKPVEAAKTAEGTENPAAPQKPLEQALRPKDDPKQSGFASIGGKGVKGAKAEKAAKKMSQSLDMTIADLGSPAVADTIRAVRELAEDTGKYADHEAIYHHLENSSEPLTAKQQSIHDAEYTPWIEESKRILAKLKARGMDYADNENFVHRIALERDAKLEKVLTQGMKYSSGARLSKSAPGLKERTMLAMEHPSTGRTMVHVDATTKDVTAYVNGREIELGDKTDLEDSGAKFNQATTKEIEADTPQRYYKHGLISTILNTLELRRAERASDAIEAFKAEPDFKYVGRKEGSETFPAGWRSVPDIPQLKGYKFEPRTAEVLERYAEELRKGLPGTMEKINEWLTRSILFNPYKHMKNIGVHWAVEKGASTLVRPDKWVSITKTGAQAIKDVLTANDNYMYAHDMGSPLQSGRRSSNELQKLLITKMTADLTSGTPLAKKILTAIGKSPAEFAKMWYDGASRLTWTFDDILRLQATYQHMAENKRVGFKDAMTEVSKHIPDYRIPTRVFGSAKISKLIRNKDLFMFSAYHYGAIKSYMEMAKDLAGRESTPAMRLKALDRLTMLMLISTVGYEGVDKLVQKATGKKDARMERSGAATFVDNAYQVIRGQKSIPSAIESVATPAPIPNIFLRMMTNPITSRISHEHPVPFVAPISEKSQVKSAVLDVANQVGPISQTGVTKTGVKGMDWQRFLLGMLGVRYGKDQGGKSGGVPRLSGIKVPKL